MSNNTIFIYGCHDCRRKGCKKKAMKNNAFFMAFCYFDCEEENSGSDFIVLKKLMLK